MAKGPSALANGDRFLITGDSLTYHPGYKNYADWLQSYMILGNPSLLLHIQAIGRSGLPISGMLDSGGNTADAHTWRKWCVPLIQAGSPTNKYASFMFADNGGFTKAQHKAYAQELIDDYFVAISGAKALLLGMIPQTNAGGYPSGSDYDDANEEIAVAATPDWPYYKLWQAISSVWTNASNYTVLRGSDQVHPSNVASALAAWKLITGLGWDTAVSTCTINGSNATLTSDTNCTVTNVTSNAFGGVDFDRLDDRLPWALDLTSQEYSDAVALYPSFANWQDYSLLVTGLPSGTYDIYCNDVLLGEATEAELATGFNMADLMTGPVYDKCIETVGCIRDMQGIHRTTLLERGGEGIVQWKSYCNQSYVTNGNSGAAGAAAHLTYLTTTTGAIGIIDDLDDIIHTAAQPASLSFSIRIQAAPLTVTATTLNVTTMVVG